MGGSKDRNEPRYRRLSAQSTCESTIYGTAGSGNVVEVASQLKMNVEYGECVEKMGEEVRSGQELGCGLSWLRESGSTSQSERRKLDADAQNSTLFALNRLGR